MSGNSSRESSRDGMVRHRQAMTPCTLLGTMRTAVVTMLLYAFYIDTLEGYEREDLHCIGPYYPNIRITCYRAVSNLDAVYVVKSLNGMVISRCYFSYPFSMKSPREFAFVLSQPGKYDVTTEISRGIFHQSFIIELKPHESQCAIEETVREEAALVKNDCVYILFGHKPFYPYDSFQMVTGCRDSYKGDIMEWKVLREYSYKSEQENCINPSKQGTVDIAGFWAMRYYRPADIFYRGSDFTIALNDMPIGYLEIVVSIYKNNSLLLTLSNLDTTKPSNSSEPHFLLHIQPYPDNLPWSSKSVFVMDTTDVQFPHLSKESGFKGTPNDFLQFKWRCSGPALLCEEVNRIVSNSQGLLRKISIDGRILRRSVNQAFSLILTMTIKGMAKHSHEVIKRISILGGDWPSMSLTCLRNCIQSRLFASVPQRLALYCENCEENTIPMVPSWPQCQVKAARCRQYMYYHNWYRPDKASNVFELRVYQGDNYHTFSFHYKFLEPEDVRTTAEQLTLDEEGKVAYIQPRLDIETNKESFEVVSVYAVFDTEDPNQPSIKINLFSSYQLAMRFTVNIEDARGFSVHEFPNVSITLCSSGVCHGSKTVPTTAIKSSYQHGEVKDISPPLTQRMNYTEGVAPLWMLMKQVVKATANTTDEIIEVAKDIFVLLKSRITYSNADVTLELVNEVTSTQKAIYKQTFLMDLMLVLKQALVAFDSCRTDVVEDTYEQQCYAALTLAKLLFWWEPQQYVPLAGGVEEAELEKMFLKNLQLVSELTVRMFTQNKQHCIGGNWIFVWEKLVLVDSNSEGYYRPEVFRNEQIMSHLRSVEFNLKALYWKMRSQPHMFDFMVHVTLFHSTKVVKRKPWIKQGSHHVDVGTTVIHMSQEYDRSSLFTAQSTNALMIYFTRKDLTTRENVKVTTVQIKSKYRVHNGELIPTCLFFKIPTTTDVLRTFSIQFHSSKHGTLFSIMSLRAKNSRQFINFHELAKVDYVPKENVYILEKVSKAYNYDNPDSLYLFRLSIHNLTGLTKDDTGDFTFYITLRLNEARCSYLDQEVHKWDLDVCKMKNITTKLLGCNCKRSAGVYSADIVSISQNVKELDVDKFINSLKLATYRAELFNPVVIAVISVWLLYLAMMVMAMKTDMVCKQMFRTHLAQYHFNPEDKYQFLICFRTSALPQAGTTARAWFQIIGTLRSTADMLLDNPGGFERGSECWFLASSTHHIGDLKGINVRMDKVAVDDNWRINVVEIYDVERDCLFRFPNYTWLSQTNPSMVCCADAGPKLSFFRKVLSRYGEMLRNYHLLLCFLLHIPGARSRVWQVTRIICTTLWCMVFTLLFVTGVPAHRFHGNHIQAGLTNVLFTVPFIMIVNFIFLRTRMMLLPNQNWRMSWPANQVPHERVVDAAERFHLPSTLSFKMRANVLLALKRKLRAVREQADVEPDGPAEKNVNTSAMDYNTSARDFSTTAKMAKSKASMFSLMSSKSYRPKLSLGVRSNSSRYRGLSRSTLQLDEIITGPPGSGNNPDNVVPGANRRSLNDRGWDDNLDKIFDSNHMMQFDGLKIGQMIHEEVWKDDPLLQTTPIFGPGVHTYTNKKMAEELRRGMHRYKPEDDIDAQKQAHEKSRYDSQSRVIGKNILWTLVILNLAICSIFLIKSSYWFREDKMKLTIIFAVLVFVFKVFIIEPVVLLLTTCISVLLSDIPTTKVWARRRSRDVHETMTRYYEMQDKGYSSRFCTFPTSAYQTFGSIAHSNWISRLLKTTSSTPGMERKFRGSLSLPVFLLCVIVIMNVHGSIQNSFRQKAMVYHSLGFNDDVEHPAQNTDLMFHFLNGKFLNFFHASEGTLGKTRVFSKISQVRVKPWPEKKNNCSAPRIPSYVAPIYACHRFLDSSNVDTKNYTRDWEKEFDPAVHELGSSEEIFEYTPGFVDNFLDYVGNDYPLGGYEYVLSGTYSDNKEMLRKMQYSQWVDDSTRAIIIETSVYDFNTGVATALVITFHFMPEGIKLTYNNQSFAFTFHNTSIIILIVAFFVLATLTLFELATQYAKAVTFGVINYIRDPENIMTLINLGFYVFIFVVFVYRYQLSYEKSATLSRTIYGTDGALFLNMRDLGMMVFFLNGFSGFLAFTALMTIFQSAKNIPKLYIMLMMIRNVFILCTFPLLVVLIVAMAGHLLFGTDLYEMSTMKAAIYSVVKFVLDPQALEMTNMFASNLYTVFQWTAFFVIITNGFLVTLNEDYSVLVVETKKGGSKSILASLTEMALASAGFINLEDPVAGTKMAELREEAKRRATEDKEDKISYFNMTHGW